MNKKKHNFMTSESDLWVDNKITNFIFIRLYNTMNNEFI